MPITILREKSSLAEFVSVAHAGLGRLGLVPTMGALHEGHLSLVQEARQQCDAVLVTIFVNPMQFGPKEDFSSYPRHEEQDIALLERAGATAVYLPKVEEMYPSGFNTVVYVKGLSEDLEGAVRPGHFDGVCTVVAKLLMQTQPQMAFFGDKDYQQLTILRRMARDLDIPVTLRGLPTIREPDGLAMSSRNAYLTKEQRRVAAHLNKTLTRAANTILSQQDVQGALDWGKQYLLQSGFDKVDYFQLRDAETLALVPDMPKRPCRLLAAAALGKTRLIDNVPVVP